MEEIARMVGISKKTIYQEFLDKKDLVTEVFKEILEEDRKKMVLILEQEDGVIDHLVKVFQVIRERLSSINPMVIVEIQKYFPEAWKMFENFKKQEIMRDLIIVMEKGKRLGYFREEIDTAILARVRMDQITSAFDPVHFADPEYNFVEEQLVLMDHFLHGIFTEKGRLAYYSQKAFQN